VPAAFFIQSDSMAIGAYKAINEAGLQIPSDISIIAFNDISIAKYMSPTLSTIKIFTKFMGETAVDLFLERIKFLVKVMLIFICSTVELILAL